LKDSNQALFDDLCPSKLEGGERSLSYAKAESARPKSFFEDV